MSKKILLIEDNKDMRENTAEILELSKYKVFTAKNGKEGVELAQKNKPGAFQLIQDVNQMLDELIAGKRQNRIYGTQKSEWYLHKKEQFNKKIEKIKSQIRVVAISSNHP